MAVWQYDSHKGMTDPKLYARVMLILDSDEMLEINRDGSRRTDMQPPNEI